MGTSDNNYTDRVVRLTELVSPDDPKLEGFTFIGCHVGGPAVLVAQGSTFIGCNLGGPTLDAVLWEIAPSRPMVVGVVLALNCHFERCTFRNVGLAGPPDFIDQFRRDAG